MHICWAHVARLHVVEASIADLADPKQHHWQPGGCLRLHSASKMCHALSHACQICAMIPHACKICDGFLHAHTQTGRPVTSRKNSRLRLWQASCMLLYCSKILVICRDRPSHMSQMAKLRHPTAGTESDLHMFACRVAAVFTRDQNHVRISN